MTTSVEFHTGVPDTVEFACRLLRKAYRRGLTVWCLAPRHRLDLLDRTLWTFVERDFIPHAQLGQASAAMLARTPIWLATALPERQAASPSVVLSLGGEVELDAAGTARVIELIGLDADEVERGRTLWRRYKAGGFEVVHHPFAAAREP